MWIDQLEPVLQGTIKVLRLPGRKSPAAPPPEELLPAEASVAPQGLSSRDLLIISGAAALGGAAVVACIYGVPLLVSKYQLHCSACSNGECCACVARPRAVIHKLLARVSDALHAGKRKVLGTGGSETRAEDQQITDSWTCVQVEDGSDKTVENVVPDPYSASKRTGYLSWDDYFMSIAFLSAQRSKDPIRQVGACLVGQDDVILGIGYNGFPRGCSDDKLPWAKLSKDGDQLKTKYPYVCHAELNAILNKNHASATGQKLYTTLFPCNECAKLIIQAGISEVIFHTDKSSSSNARFAAARKLLCMANIKVRQHRPNSRSITLNF